MNQRCRQRLDAGCRHIREYIQSQHGAAGSVPQDGKELRKLKAIKKVMSTQSWRAYLVRNIWQDGLKMPGMNLNMSNAPANFGQGIADDVDGTLPTFLQHEIRVEAAKAKQPVMPHVPTPTHPQGTVPSSASSLASSGNISGVVGSSSQYAPGSISQPENGRQHLGTASSSSMQSSFAPQAQPTLSNGRSSNGRP
jgi:hypothetical protein